MADAAVYSAEKFLTDNGDKIPETNRAAVQSEIETLKAAMSSGDSSGMQSGAERLQGVLQQAGAAMYQAGAAGPESSGPESGPTGGDNGRSDEDVVEGEFSDAN